MLSTYARSIGLSLLLLTWANKDSLPFIALDKHVYTHDAAPTCRRQLEGCQYPPPVRRQRPGGGILLHCTACNMYTYNTTNTEKYMWIIGGNFQLYKLPLGWLLLQLRPFQPSNCGPKFNPTKFNKVSSRYSCTAYTSLSSHRSHKGALSQPKWLRLCFGPPQVRTTKAHL